MAIEQIVPAAMNNKKLVQQSTCSRAHIWLLCVYWNMKVRLNTIIDAQLLSEVKTIAAERKMSLSQIIENYFKSIVREKPVKKSNLFDLIEELTPREEIVEQSMNIKLCYEEPYKHINI